MMMRFGLHRQDQFDTESMRCVAYVGVACTMSGHDTIELYEYREIDTLNLGMNAEWHVV